MFTILAILSFGIYTWGYTMEELCTKVWKRTDPCYIFYTWSNMYISRKLRLASPGTHQGLQLSDLFPPFSL